MTRRAQLVILAAVLVTVALVPVVLAYLQLGYHADVRASGAEDDPTRDATGVLVRAVHDASADVPGEYQWSRRSAAVTAVRTDLAPRIETVETARVEDGIARNVAYNQSLASRWAGSNCPDGPARQFGSCEAIAGVVVQERAGRTHVLAVAVDVRTTTEDELTRVATVLEAVGDDRG